MKKILIVEDDFLLQKMYYQKFLDEGFDVILASNGRECIDKAKLDLPDFILLDLNMPGIDGVTALRQLKNNDDTKKIPVAIFTAKEGDMSEIIPDPALASQTAGFWKKGELIPSELVKQVKQILGLFAK